MAWIPRRGEVVIAGQFGEGIVQKITRTTAVVRLKNPSVDVELSLQHVAPLGSGALVQTESEVSPIKFQRPPSDETAAKRRSIEALRFGVVPQDGIAELTLGYDDLREWTLSRLPHRHGGAPQVSAICGPFGSGKSHTMAVIRHVARQEGYVTARVEVNGLNISLSDPERLLYALWCTLAANGLASSTPLLDLCVKAIDRGHPPPSVAPRGIDRVQDNYGTVELLKRSPGAMDNHGHALDAIMSSSDEFTAQVVALMIGREPGIYASDVRVRRMIGQRVDHRPYDFLEAWVGYALVAQLAGYTGLCLTIDEFEVEHLLPRAKFDRIVDLLKVLRSYFANELSHPRAPLSVFFATVGEEGHVGDREVDALIEAAGGEGDYYRLKTWSREERAELARRIHRMYSQAYGGTAAYSSSVAEEVENYLERRGATGGDDLIRAFIKTYVGALDSLCGPTP